MFSPYDHLKLKASWLGEGNMHFNFCMWFFGLVKCLGLWAHILKLNALLMLLESSLIVDVLGWGLITWIAFFFYDVLIGCVINKP
jgi:hypothetical protein